MAKIHYDELTVGVPSKASSVNYENADGTKESVQSKISKILQTEEDTQDDVEGIKQNIADQQSEIESLENANETVFSPHSGVYYVKQGRTVTVEGKMAWNADDTMLDCPEPLVSEFPVLIRDDSNGNMGIVFCNGTKFLLLKSSITIQTGKTVVFSFSYISKS